MQTVASFLDQYADALQQLVVAHIILAPLLLLFIDELGVPFLVPGDAILGYVGYRLALTHSTTVAEAFAVALGVVFIGSSVLFLIAKRYGQQLINVTGKYLFVKQSHVTRAEKLFNRYGAWAIIFGRHIPGVRLPLTAFAVGSGMKYFVFISCTMISTAGWILFYLTIGDRYGHDLRNIVPGYEVSSLIILAVVVGSIVGLHFWRRKIRKGWTPLQNMRLVRYTALCACVAVLAVAGIAGYNYLHHNNSSVPSRAFAYATQSSLPAATHFDHIVIIMEENESNDAIIGNPSAPYINKLAATYSRASDYYAVSHPSLPNYIALTSGTTAGITSDCNPPGGSCLANVPNIADRLDQSGVSWKEYAESMPQPCDPNDTSLYAVKHNPFMYYPDIADNAALCDSRVVPFSQFAGDLRSASSLPSYVFITPNLCDDMHNCSIASGDSWLAEYAPKILDSPAFTTQHSLLVVAWDEGNSADNNVAIIFAGPAAKAHYVSNVIYSHYSLLHTIENNWGLKPLTQNDMTASVMSAMLR